MRGRNRAHYAQVSPGARERRRAGTLSSAPGAATSGPPRCWVGGTSPPRAQSCELPGTSGRWPTCGRLHALRKRAYKALCVMRNRGRKRQPAPYVMQRGPRASLTRAPGALRGPLEPSQGPKKAPSRLQRAPSGLVRTKTSQLWINCGKLRVNACESDAEIEPPSPYRGECYTS